MAEDTLLPSLLNLVYIGSFFLFFVYGQRIQTTLMLIRVRRNVARLERLRNSARERFLDSVLRYRTDRTEAESKVDRLLDSFAIMPVSLDPSGIVRKLEHILDTYDEHLKAEVRTLAASASETDVNNLSNLLEVSIGLDTMYRVVRHYYLLARKQGGILALAQLQMSLPTIMDEAEAYYAALEPFSLGKPVGDGVGPLFASKLASGIEGKELVKDTLVHEVMWEGRKMLIVRAKGPGGNVGRPGSAVEKLIQEAGPIGLVITVDAALKLEGETSGQIAEGVGAAIGGPGTERYRIEEAAVRHGIPLLAVVVKMSSKEAISAMTAEVNKAVEEVQRRVHRAITERTKPTDAVIVAGIGNTIGVP